jgi:hypothetical protein
VDDVGVARSRAQRSSHRGNDDGRQPRLPLESRDYSRVTTEPAVALGANDGDLDIARAQVLDEVGDESSGEVLLVARIGGREDGDLQLAEIL